MIRGGRERERGMGSHLRDVCPRQQHCVGVGALGKRVCV